MPLISTETPAKATEGQEANGSKTEIDPQADCAPFPARQSQAWCYLFIHQAKINMVNKKLEESFPIFIHKSITYKQADKRIRKIERPTISGLVFIQGDTDKVQKVLSENFFGLYLVKNCSSKEVAVIPDEIMQPFMRMSQINPTRIRFMPHPFEYYADGHTLVKITSGILAGMEGYRIRISRDKCLVTSIGGMTVAINGIYKDSFENLDEYVRQRRLQLNSGKAAARLNLSPLQAEIDACFFTPQNQLDILALTENIKPWVERTQNELKAKRFDDVAETALFLLEEMGSRFQTLYSHPQFNACLKETNSLCRQLDNALLTLAGSLDVATDLKEVVETQRQSLLIRFPFLPLDE